VANMNEFTFHNYRNKLPLKNKLARFMWSIYATFLFRSLPTKYLNGLRVAGLRLFGAKVGRRGVSVHRTVRIWAPWNLEMADYTLIDRACRIYNPASVIVNSESVISENVFLCAASHDVNSLTHDLIAKPILLEGKNWVAADAMILPGVKVGEGAVVAARAVVVKDVPAWSIVGGNPCRVISHRILNGGGNEF